MLHLRYEKRSVVQVPSSMYLMSHRSLGKQSCMAWLKTTETWISKARGRAHHRQVCAKCLIQFDSHLHLNKFSDHQNHCVYLTTVRVHVHVNLSFPPPPLAVPLCCASGLVHLNPSTSGSFSSARITWPYALEINSPVQTAKNLCCESLSQHASCCLMLLLCGSKHLR